MKHYLCLDYGYNSSYLDKIKLIQKNNFDGVFLLWNENFEETVKLSKDANLDIETIHLPARECNNIWLENDEGYTDIIIQGVRDAAKHGIKTVIFHVSSKDNPPAYNQIGIDRLKSILKVCEEGKVNFALENLRRLDYLDYVYQNLNSQYLKFCYDSGHANAFTKNIENFPWEKYQDKLCCIHLHDNDGLGDKHQIPFSGNINWEKLMKKLKEINYEGPLTCEAVIKNPEISEEEYVYNIKQALEKLEKYIK